MKAVSGNIKIMQKIISSYGDLDTYYNSIDPIELVLSLGGAKGTYKLGGMGIALVAEYLKNVGIDVAKPDTHVCRILKRLGLIDNNLSGDKETIEAMKICNEMAKANGMTTIEIDGLLWSFCAEGQFHQCIATPDCAVCALSKKGLCIEHKS